VQAALSSEKLNELQSQLAQMRSELEAELSRQDACRLKDYEDLLRRI